MMSVFREFGDGSACGKTRPFRQAANRLCYTKKFPSAAATGRREFFRSVLGLCFVGLLDDDRAVDKIQAVQFEVLPLFQTDRAGHLLEVRGTWRLNRCGDSRPIGGRSSGGAGFTEALSRLRMLKRNACPSGEVKLREWSAVTLPAGESPCRNRTAPLSASRPAR